MHYQKWPSNYLKFIFLAQWFLFRSPDKTLKALTAVCKSMSGVVDQVCTSAITKEEAKLDLTMLKDCMHEIHSNLQTKTSEIERRVAVRFNILLVPNLTILFK